MFFVTFLKGTDSNFWSFVFSLHEYFPLKTNFSEYTSVIIIRDKDKFSFGKKEKDAELSTP